MKQSMLAFGLAGAMLVNWSVQGALPEEIRGTLRDTNGAPVVGMRVEVFPGDTLTNTKTDTNGAYQVKAKSIISPNANIVFARDRARNLAAARELQEGEDVYDLQLAPAAIITGRVQNEQGMPLTNAEMTLLVAIGNGSFRIDSDISARTDSQGHFEIRAVPMGGVFGLYASAKGYGTFANKMAKLETNRWEVPPITLRTADKKVAGVVVDANQKPVKGVSVSTTGDDQPYNIVNTDDKGRFAFNQVCDGMVSLRARYLLPTVGTRESDLASGNARVKAGDTNVLITLDKSSEPVPITPPEPYRRDSLIGKKLPDLTAEGIPANVQRSGKQVLVCLFDPEQRPSRRVLQLLTEQNETLKKKGVTVIGVNAARTKADVFNEWKQTNPLPFVVGAVNGETESTRWILRTRTLPCLILTDAQGIVKSDGFDLGELDSKLNGPADPVPPPEPTQIYPD